MPYPQVEQNRHCVHTRHSTTKRYKYAMCLWIPQPNHTRKHSLNKPHAVRVPYTCTATAPTARPCQVPTHLLHIPIPTATTTSAGQLYFNRAPHQARRFLPGRREVKSRVGSYSTYVARFYEAPMRIHPCMYPAQHPIPALTVCSPIAVSAGCGVRGALIYAGALIRL
jgi:hypothetical protein